MEENPGEQGRRISVPPWRKAGIFLLKTLFSSSSQTGNNQELFGKGKQTLKGLAPGAGSPLKAPGFLNHTGRSVPEAPRL